MSEVGVIQPALLRRHGLKAPSKAHLSGEGLDPLTRASDLVGNNVFGRTSLSDLSGRLGYTPANTWSRRRTPHAGKSL